MSLSKTMLPNIGELRQREVRRIYLPRTSVNKTLRVKDEEATTTGRLLSDGRSDLYGTSVKYVLEASGKLIESESTSSSNRLTVMLV